MTASASSIYEYCVDMPGSAFEGDEPLNANFVQYAHNNLQHLNDMSTQHRYNWVSAVGDTGIQESNAGLNGATEYFVVSTVYFPASMSLNRQPENLVVRIAAKTSGANAQLDVYINPWALPASRSFDNQMNIANFSDSITSVASWISQRAISSDYGLNKSPINYTTVTKSKASLFPLFYTEPSGTGLTTQYAPMNFYRMSMYGQCSTSATTISILGISIREHHDQ